MKKPIFSVLVGLCLGVLLMLGVVWTLNMKPDNEDILAQDKDNTESEWEAFETEIWIEESEFTEEVLQDETIESEVESESEKENKKPQKKPAAQKKPINYPYFIRVNRQANCVTIYGKDTKGNYTVPIKAMTCSVGLTGETPLGITKITARYVWRPLFGGTYGQYTVRFNGHILFHSVPYTNPSKDSLMEGQFNMLGQPASQGCIRLSAADAKWIYDNCRIGTKVEVYDSADPGPLGKPATIRVNENSPYRGWDPTDPDPTNPWKKGKVHIYGVKNIIANQGETVNLLAGVNAIDVDGLPLKVTVSDTVDLNVPGTYNISYSATGVLGITEKVSATVTIKEVELPKPPEDTEAPEDTEIPEDTQVPENTEIPEDTEKPEDVEDSEGTQAPEAMELTNETDLLEDIGE